MRTSKIFAKTVANVVKNLFVFLDKLPTFRMFLCEIFQSPMKKKRHCIHDRVVLNGRRKPRDFFHVRIRFP